MTTVVAVAGGPSFNAEQAAMLQSPGVRVAVVNRGWERLPHADLLYAADQKWWTGNADGPGYAEPVLAGFSGECWTQDAEAARRYGLCHIKSANKPGLSRDPGVIHSGGNGGYALVNLLRHLLKREPGEHTIALVGYDMQEGPNKEAHWHPDYPARWGNSTQIAAWAPRFDQLYADLIADGIRVVNCSLRTAITSIPRADLAETIKRDCVRWPDGLDPTVCYIDRAMAESGMQALKRINETP